MNKHNLDELANTLDQHDDYRVLRRLEELRRYHADPVDPTQLRRGVYLDVETTGLDHATDAIIQLAIVPFSFTVDGLVCSVNEGLEQFDDPGQPIPERVTQLTGITDEQVRGKKIDDSRVQQLIDPADLVIAHNAGFDRPFAEKRLKFFEKKAWGCAMREIPWRDEDIESAKLEYIAYRYGFFYDGHRADTDCRAGIHILAQNLKISGQPVLATLLASARRNTCRLWAVNAPYEARTLLKARGYRWNNGEDGRHKAWFIDSDSDQAELEKEYLLNEIYKRDIQLPIDKITCFERYSDRI